MSDLVFKNHTSQKAPSDKFFKKILDMGTKELEIKNKKTEISLNLVGEAKIKELNKKYRHKNKVTDVLSFPMSENIRSLPAYQLTSLQALDMGDIFICLSFAKKQAKSENVSIEKELARLTVHGFLHLLGYDHERSQKDEIEMFELENKILKKCQNKGQFAV